MPTYCYLCKECGKETELIQRISEPALTHCPDCGGDVQKRLFATKVHYEGDGYTLNTPRK